MDDSYSQDVEIGPDNKLYWARDHKKGAVVKIPLHMLDKVQKTKRP